MTEKDFSVEKGGTYHAKNAANVTLIMVTMAQASAGQGVSRRGGRAFLTLRESVTPSRENWANKGTSFGTDVSAASLEVCSHGILHQAYGAEMSDSCTKKVQMTLRDALFLTQGGATAPSTPAASSCVQVRRVVIRHHQGRSEMFVRVCFFLGMRWCLLAHFSTTNSSHFVANWTKKYAHKPFF